MLEKGHGFLKTAQNYIMKGISNKRPFPLHEQSWYRAALLNTGRLSFRQVKVELESKGEVELGIVDQRLFFIERLLQETSSCSHADESGANIQ